MGATPLRPAPDAGGQRRATHSGTVAVVTGDADQALRTSLSRENRTSSRGTLTDLGGGSDHIKEVSRQDHLGRPRAQSV